MVAAIRDSAGTVDRAARAAAESRGNRSILGGVEHVRSMRIALPTVALALAVIAGLSAPAAPSTVRGAGEPVPLSGAPIPGDTGLRLVVADNPPFVLDVDTGSVTSVPGVPPLNGGTVSIVGVAGRAAVVVARPDWPRADLYAVRGPAARVSALGSGTDVAPAADGRSVWVKTSSGEARCALRQISLDGQTIRAPRAFPCASTISLAGSLGLVVNRTRVIDPFTGRTLLRTQWGVLAAAGQTLVLAGPNDRFTVLDAATRAQRRVPWPRTVGGLDAPAVDPRGRFVALAFAHPAWKGGPQQALDVWLLDTKTARLTHLPGMPALVSLKRTSMAWTHDGRLVLLGASGGRELVAVWSPGQRQLAVKTVHLPERGDSGSDSFAVLG